MKLIINADDFGLSKSISDGIIKGIKDGYITSTSVMANMKYAEYAIKNALENNISCIGLHINFTKGKPIIPNPNLTDNNGVFLGRTSQIENIKLTYEDAYNEIKAQIDIIDKYSNGKFKIDHIDAHHFVSLNINIRNAIIDIAKEYNIPIRNEFECDILKPEIFYMDFSLKNIDYKELENMLSLYKDKDTSVELLTHPGFVDDYTMNITSHNIQREQELNILRKAKDNGLFDQVELISFKQL